ADGREAVAAVLAWPVGLVLLDILLPGVDGIEILQELKGIEPKVPVIMMTAVKTIRTTVAAMKAGALDYVTKPFREEELLRIIRGAVVPYPRHRTTEVEHVQRSHESHLPRARQILIVDRNVGRRATLAVLLARFGSVVATSEDLDRVGRAL